MSKFSQLKLFWRTAFLLVPVTAILITFPATTQNATVMYDGFEEAELVVGGEEGWREEVCCSNSLQLVKDPVRVGKQALKVTLKKSAPAVNGGSRAEIRKRTIPADSEQWYAFSLLIPKDFEEDRAVTILAQWHSMPDDGESWRSPMMHLNVKRRNLFVHRRWDSRQITQNNAPEGTENIDLGAYSAGQWMDFVFHLKWSSSSDGLVEIWKDGALVAIRRGPNAYNDKGGIFPKIGLYKPDWGKNEKSSTSIRLVYFDEVRLGDENASFKDVSPKENNNRASGGSTSVVHELQPDEEGSQEKKASPEVEGQENVKESQAEERL